MDKELDIEKKIKKLEKLVSKVEKDCNLNPFDISKVEADLAGISFVDNYERLFAEMPGPLARVFIMLKRKTDESYFYKFSLIKNYVLMLMIIINSILLGMIRGKSKFYEKNKKTIFSSVKNFKALCMGDLINLGRTLTKIIRRGNENGVQTSELFYCFSDEFAKKIVSNDVFDLAEEFSMHRNKLMGHSGLVSEEGMKSSFKRIVKLFYKIVDHSFFLKEAKIISGISFFNKNDIIYGNVNYMTGFVFPYLVKEIKLNEILENGKLYLLADGCHDPIVLPELIHAEMSRNEEHLISYFYNRVENGSVRYVCYEAPCKDIYIKMSKVNEDLINT